MPKYNVTDPETGRNLVLEGDSPPTEAELNDVFAAANPRPQPSAEEGYQFSPFAKLPAPGPLPEFQTPEKYQEAVDFWKDKPAPPSVAGAAQSAYQFVNKNLVRLQPTGKEIMEGARQFTAAGAYSTPERLGIPEATPDQLANAEKSKAFKIVTGAVQGVGELEEFFTSPLGIATLGTGSLPAAAQKAIAVAFTAQMASQIPDQAKSLIAEIRKPEAERDYREIARQTVGGIGTLGFTTAGALHAAAPPAEVRGIPAPGTPVALAPPDRPLRPRVRPTQPFVPPEPGPLGVIPPLTERPADETENKEKINEAGPLPPVQRLTPQPPAAGQAQVGVAQPQGQNQTPTELESSPPVREPVTPSAAGPNVQSETVVTPGGTPSPVEPGKIPGNIVLTPVLKVGDARLEGRSHLEAAKSAPDALQADALIAFSDDANHIFKDQNGKEYTREEAAKVFDEQRGNPPGKTKHLQSKDLMDAGLLGHLDEPMSSHEAKKKEFAGGEKPVEKTPFDFGAAGREAKANLDKAVNASGDSDAIELTSPKYPTMRVVISRDPSEVGKWRATRIDEHGPSGHNIYNSREEALSDYTGGHKTSGPSWGWDFTVQRTQKLKSKSTPEEIGWLRKITSARREWKRVGDGPIYPPLESTGVSKEQFNQLKKKGLVEDRGFGPDVTTAGLYESDPEFVKSLDSVGKKPTLAPESKPPVAPEAKPTVATAPTDISKHLDVPIADVSEASTRVKVVERRQRELRSDADRIQTEIKALEKTIKPQRGNPYTRSKIKKSAKASDVARYRELQVQYNNIGEQLSALDDTVKDDRRTVEQSEDAAIVSDKNQPLLRRLDRRVRMLGDKAPPELVKALIDETERVIREKYPDATPEEISRLAPEVQRASFFGGDIWKSRELPNLYDIRRSALDAALEAPDVPKHLFPSELKDKLNRFTSKDRAYSPTPVPVEDLSASQLADLKSEIRAASGKIQADLKAEAERHEEEQRAESIKLAQLTEEAQKIADSAPRTGTPGGRSAKEVKADLVSRIKGVLDEMLGKSDVTLKEGEKGEYVASSASSGVTAFGSIEPSGKSSFKVTVKRIAGDSVTLTVPTEEEARWVIKAMASEGAGKAVIGVPGDGVFRLNRSGESLVKLWKDARGIETSSGGSSYKGGGGAERPPSSIKTERDWKDAKEYHGLEPLDKIYDWSPALRVVAEKVNPEHPEAVTALDVDGWFNRKKEGKSADASEQPPPSDVGPGVSNREKAEQLAKSLDKLKSGFQGGRAGQINLFGVIPAIWDRAVTIAQAAIRAGGTIADAVEAAIRYIKDSFNGQWDEAGARKALAESKADEPTSTPPQSELPGPDESSGKTGRHQVAGVRKLGAEYQPENISKQTAFVRQNLFDSTRDVSTATTDEAWSFYHQMTGRDKADNARMVAMMGGGEMAPGVLKNELWDYAVKMSAQGDPSLLRSMVDNYHEFQSIGGGEGAESEAGRVLRAAKDRAESPLWKASVLFAKQLAIAAGKKLGVGPDLFNEIVSSLQSPNVPLDELSRIVNEGKDSTGKTIADYMKDAGAPDADATGRRTARRSRAEMEDAQRQAVRYMEQIEKRRGAEWIKPEARPTITKVIAEFLRPKGGVPPSIVEGTFSRELSNRLVEAGVEKWTADRIATSVYQQEAARQTTQGFKEMGRAADSNNLNSLVEHIMATPYRAQHDPAWRQRVAMDWFMSNGVSRDRAQAAAELFSKKFDEAFTAAAEREASRLLAKGKAGPDSIREVIKAIRLGLTDPDKPWAEEIAKRSGFKPLTREQHAQVAKLDAELNNPALSPQEFANINEQMRTIFVHAGTHEGTFMRAVGEGFVMSLLSGVRTLTLHEFIPMMMAVRDLPHMAAADPRNAWNFSKAIYTAYRKVLASETKYAWQHDAYGFALASMDREYNTLKRVFDEAEQKYQTGSAGQKATARLTQLYASQHYVAKILNTVVQSTMAATREWKLAYYSSIALREAGLSTKMIGDLMDTMALARQTDFEQAMDEGLDANTARVRANYLQTRAVEAWVTDKTKSAALGREVLEAAERDVYSMQGRKAPGIKEEDEGGLSRFGMNQFIRAYGDIRREGGPSSIFATAMFGFVSIPYRVMRFMSNYHYYGLVRYGIDRWRVNHGKDTLWKQSYGNALQARARFREALTGSVLTTLAAAWAYGNTTSDDKAGKEGFGLYITGGGPTNKTLRDAYDKAGWKRYSLNFVVDGRKVVVPLTRAGVALMFPFMIPAGMDDAAWKKKEFAATGRSDKFGVSNEVGALIGAHFYMSGQHGILQSVEAFSRATEGGSGALKAIVKVAAAATSASVLPYKQMLASLSDMFVGPIDQSSMTSVIASNFPLVGLPFQTRGVNRFGDELYDQSWFGKINRTGIPVSFQVSQNPENKALYEDLLLQKGAAPPALMRSNIQERYGPLTDEQWQKFTRLSGKNLKETVTGGLEGLKLTDPEEVKKFLTRAATDANDEAASALGLERIKDTAKAPLGGGPAPAESLSLPKPPQLPKIGAQAGEAGAPAPRTAPGGSKTPYKRSGVRGVSNHRVSLSGSRASHGRSIRPRLARRGGTGRIRLHLARTRKIRVHLV